MATIISKKYELYLPTYSINSGSHLSRNLVSSWFPESNKIGISKPNPTHNIWGHSVIINPTIGQEKLCSAYYNGEIASFQRTSSYTSEQRAGPKIIGKGRLFSSKPVTFLAKIHVGVINSDRCLIDFAPSGSSSGSSCSWLDYSGGALRIAIYSAYDTTNTITTTGDYIVGFTVDTSGNYQTYFNGAFSQSGTATRQQTNTDLVLMGQAGKVAFCSSINNGQTLLNGLYWAHAWNRELTEPELWSICEDPAQVFYQSNNKVYIKAAYSAAGGPTPNIHYYQYMQQGGGAGL